MSLGINWGGAGYLFDEQGYQKTLHVTNQAKFDIETLVISSQSNIAGNTIAKFKYEQPYSALKISLGIGFHF